MRDLNFVWVGGKLDVQGDFAVLLSGWGQSCRRISLCEGRLQEGNPAGR